MANSGRFTNPSSDGSGLTYTVGSVVQIAWETSLERITLTLWSVNSTNFDYLPQSANLANTNSFPWSVGSVSTTASYPAVEVKTDISNKVFFFVMFIPGNTSPSFSSNKFRIIDSVSASTGATASSFSSSSLPSTSTTTSSSSSLALTSTTTSSFSVLASTVITSSSPTSSILTSTQSSNPASSTALATNSGLSKDAKAGIGVGVGIGVPLLLALGIFLGWKFGGRRNSKGSRGGHNTSNVGAAEFQPASKEVSRLRMNNLHEAPQAELRPNELNSTPIHQLE